MLIHRKHLSYFRSPFEYLYNAEYIPAKVKTELRQQSVAEGLIGATTADFQPPSTTTTTKNTYQ